MMGLDVFMSIFKISCYFLKTGLKNLSAHTVILQNKNAVVLKGLLDLSMTYLKTNKKMYIGWMYWNMTEIFKYKYIYIYICIYRFKIV